MGGTESRYATSYYYIVAQLSSGGHSVATATYSRLKCIFAWKHMESLVQNFIQNCLICAQAKPDHSAYLGKLHPLPIP
jgi:hypothetical protein